MLSDYVHRDQQIPGRFVNYIFKAMKNINISAVMIHSAFKTSTFYNMIVLALIIVISVACSNNPDSKSDENFQPADYSNSEPYSAQIPRANETKTENSGSLKNNDPGENNGIMQQGASDVNNSGSSAQFRSSHPAQTASSFQGQNAGSNQVVIMDQGLQMATGTYTLPDGWKIFQDVAFDPQTGRQSRYSLDIYGTGGELIRGFPFAEYGQLYGRSFDQSWKEPVMRSVGQQMSNFALGEMRISQHLQNSRVFREMIAEAGHYGMSLQGLETPFRGVFNGKNYSGMVYVINMSSPELQSMGMGMAFISLVTSPAETFQQTLAIRDQIEERYQQNHRHKQRVAELVQRNTQQNMANSQASFNAHQQRMATMQQGFDAQNRQWSENFFGSAWGTSSGSGYSSHDAFIDGITEHSTFDDPSTGFQVRKEGHYKYNYTDGMGNFYGTDDPSFNPASLQGNWQKTEPLRPGN
jgi:hypothetical protein